ncbi:MAG: hypothetical protein E6R09_11725 [Rhodocyclaceae bacterium]|nr:MAG: hypothetical protein E6R09_11725 [Rhodocyclaceae bacterium]
MIETLLSPMQDSASDAAVEPCIERLKALPGRMPFDAVGMSFVGQLSRQLLINKVLREYPELMAMAHWFRAASLPDLRMQLLGGDGESVSNVFLPRGVIFHIAPSNVDSVFIYSWLLSLLCGNINIARVSRRRSRQMQVFFEHVKGLLASSEFAHLAQTNWVLSYDHDAQLTEQLSSVCQMRVVWGGDETVSLVRKIPLPPLSAELAFANRFSMAVLNSDAVCDLDEPGLTELTRRFYNDAFWFNQRACSSPKIVWWIGERDAVKEARERFWSALSEHVGQQQPENEPAQVVNRLTNSFLVINAHDRAQLQSDAGALPARISIERLRELDRRLHDGQGLFLELQRPSLSDLIPELRSRDQTLAHFGFARAELLTMLAGLPARAVDRLVPVGEALAFNAVWDGVNLLRAFTREVQIRCA